MPFKETDLVSPSNLKELFTFKHYIKKHDKLGKKVVTAPPIGIYFYLFYK